MKDKTFWAISNSSGDAEEARGLLLTLEYSAAYFGARWGGGILGNGSKPGEVLSDAPALQAASVLFLEP